MGWTTTVNNAATRNKQRLRDAGLSTEGHEATAELHEIEEKMPGVTLPKAMQDAIDRQKEQS